MESKNDYCSRKGRFCFSTARSSDPENTGIQSQKNILVREWPSSTDIATTPFLERRCRYESPPTLFVSQSMRLASDETSGAYTGIRGAGHPLCFRSSSRRSTKSSLLAVVNSFRGLGFSRREGSHSSTLRVDSLRTFP